MATGDRPALARNALRADMNTARPAYVPAGTASGLIGVDRDGIAARRVIGGAGEQLSVRRHPAGSGMPALSTPKRRRRGRSGYRWHSSESAARSGSPIYGLGARWASSGAATRPPSRPA